MLSILLSPLIGLSCYRNISSWQGKPLIPTLVKETLLQKPTGFGAIQIFLSKKNSIKRNKSCSTLNNLFDSALWTAQTGCIEHWPTCVQHHLRLKLWFGPKHEQASSSTLRPDKTGNRIVDYVNTLYKNTHLPPRERMNWMVDLWLRDKDGFR